MGQRLSIGDGGVYEHILGEGDALDLMFSYNPNKDVATNGNNFHAVTIRGLLDEDRLRRAVDALQERHPRMRAKFYFNQSTEKPYLVETKERVPLAITSGSYATLNKDIEALLMRDIDSSKGPMCHITYVKHEEEGTGLLAFCNNHCVGDGRCCEILMSQLLRLYDGQTVPFFKTCTSLLSLKPEVRPEKIEEWRRIEAQMPERDYDTVSESFVDPMHPDFVAKFDGICFESVRVEPEDADRLLKVCRSEGTTVTGALAAAVQYAILAELCDRKRQTEFVNIGFDMNARGRRLGPEYDEECGNFVIDARLRVAFEDQFWNAARKFTGLVKQIVDSDCGYEAMVAQNGDEFLSNDGILAMKEISSADAAAATFASMEHCNLSSLGVLKRFVQYKDFEVLENYTGSNIGFAPCKVNICTSGSSGRLSVCVMVAKNVVPESRQAACTLRDHLARIIQGIIAPSGSTDNAETMRWCAQSASRMREAVKTRLAKIQALKDSGHKGRAGEAFLGDMSGAYDCSTHLQVFLNVIGASLASGVLAGYPVYQKDLQEAGVFNIWCTGEEASCDAQAIALANLYSNALYVTFLLSFVCGMWFDFYGARTSSIGGSFVCFISLLIIAVGVGLDSKQNYVAEYVLLYTGCILADFGSFVASMSLLGWLWHYPRSQTFLIGLANATSQVAAILGVLVQYLVQQGLSLSATFAIMSLSGAVAIVIMYFCVPTHGETLAQAAKVLNMSRATLTPASPSLRGIKLQLKSLYSCLCVFPDYHIPFYVSCIFAMVGYMNWTSSFGIKYDVWFDVSTAKYLNNYYAVVLSLAALFYNPLSGALLDKIGISQFFALPTISAIGMALTESVRAVSSQVAFMWFFSLYVGTGSNIAGKWPTYFVSPTLMGITFASIQGLSAVFGIVYNLLKYLLVVKVSPDLEITAFLSVAGICFAFLTILMLTKGLPKKPPRNRYDSRARCMGQ